MKISVIQSEQHFTYDPAQPGEWDLAALRRAAQGQMDETFAMLEAAARDGAQFLVTIEAMNQMLSFFDARYPFTDVCEPLDGPLIARFRALAKRYGSYIVGGLFTTREGRAYNSAVLFGPDGEIAGLFDKVHLPAGEERVITPGDRFPVFATDYGIVGMLICWDMQFPEAARELALAGADLIALPTWGWEKRYGLCRAYENSVTVAAAMGSPCGIDIWECCDPSGIVDHMGEVLAEGPRRGPAIVSAEVDLRREPVPQYGAGEITGMPSMRQIRLSQRRPGTYRLVNEPAPPVMARYAVSTK